MSESQTKTLKECLAAASESLALNDPHSAQKHINEAVKLEQNREDNEPPWRLISMLVGMIVAWWVIGHSIQDGYFHEVTLVTLTGWADWAMACLSLVAFLVFVWWTGYISAQLANKKKNGDIAPDSTNK